MNWWIGDLVVSFFWCHEQVICKVEKVSTSEKGCQNIGKMCRILLWMVPLLIFLIIPRIFLLCMGVNDMNAMETKIDFIKKLNSELQSNFAIRNFLVTLKLFLTAKSSLSLWSKCKLVTGNGSLIQICSLSNRSLLPSLTVLLKVKSKLTKRDWYYGFSVHCQAFLKLKVILHVYQCNELNGSLNIYPKYLSKN